MNIRNEFAAGVFVLAALFLFSASIWFLGRERQIFAQQVEYHAVAMSGGGLAVGAPVRLAGLGVGRVASIGFADDLADPRVHIVLLINEDFVERIRVDSVVTIETQGLLGDKFVSISPGQSGTQLAPGSTIQSGEQVDITQVMKQAEVVVSRVVDIAADVGELFDTIQPKLTTAVDSISAAADNFSHVSESTHKLLSQNEKAVTETIADLEIMSKNLRRVSEALAQGEGTLGALLLDAQLYNNAVEITDGAKRSFILRQAIRAARSSAEQEKK